MKLTTFNLFLILLLVLVISVLICRKCNNIFNDMEEGFTVPTGFNEVHIDKYGSSADYKIYRLTDRYYFDPKNGNLIEVEGTIDTSTKELTLTKLHITTRPVTAAGVMTNASTISYEIQSNSNDIMPSTSFSNSYSSYLYYSKITGENTVVLYVPNQDKTFIHIFSNTAVSGGTTQTIGVGQSFYFGYNPITADNFDSSSLSSITLGSAPVENTDSYNGTIISPFYNVDPVYKVTDNVYFDIKYGSLIINKPAIVAQPSATPPISAVPASIDIYKHTPTTPMETKTTQNSIARCTVSSCMDANTNAIGFNVRTMKEGENMVIMMVFGDKTIVAVLCIDSNSGASPKTLKIRNIVRFNRNGTDNNFNDNTRTVSNSVDENKDDNNQHELSRHRKDYENEYWIDRLKCGSLMDDYMLKTQVVPPVCPACPACPARSEICTNCGGNGGNGTLTNTGSSVVNTVGQPITRMTDALGNTIVGTAGAAGQAISGTAGAAGKAITGTANVAGNVITGTVGAVSNLASNVVGSATDLLKSTGSGITGLIDRSSSNNQYSSNKQSVLDPYSYQGQLNKPRDLSATTTPAKYLPLTADFSAFGR
jgi:hypothetical protein